MRLGWNDMKLIMLVSVLGLSIWTIGCGEPASPVSPIAPASSGGSEAGSTTGGGIDVPMTDVDSGTAKPTEDKPADAGEPKTDADKPADADKKEEPKADEAKKDDAPAETKEEKKE